MYGTQANHNYIYNRYQFENDVKMYGTQAIQCYSNKSNTFENDVKMYGTQATELAQRLGTCLRMM